MPKIRSAETCARISAALETPLPEQEIRALYKSGMSQLAIGVKFGVGQDTISRFMKRRGIASRRERPPLGVADGVARITLSRGMVALVDECDLSLVSGYKWYAVVKGNGTGYAYAHRHISQKCNVPIAMHRIVVGDIPDGACVDHRNGDGLDNRRSNLRIASNAQNTRNQKGRGAISGYKGVYRSAAKCARWNASITFNGKAIYLGTFISEMDAARAYNEAAVKLFGDFARLNSQDGAPH